MPLPGGIQKRTVTFGPGMTMEAGDSLAVKVSVKSSRSLVWAATGAAIRAVEKSYESDAGLEIEVSLPVTDQAGWLLDGAIVDVTAGKQSHYYIFELEFYDSTSGKLVDATSIAPVAVPTGDLSPIDGDKLIPATSTGGATISIPDSWSEAVTLAQAAATEAAAKLVDSAAFVRTTVVDDIGDDESDIATTLKATIGGMVAGVVGASVDAVRLNGDSLTDNLDEALLATALGVPVANGGFGGWASSDIAIKQGGLRPAITVTGNSIPSSGSVTVTAISPATSYRADGSGSKSWSVNVLGQTCTLTNNMDTDTWSIAQVGGTGALAVPPATVVYDEGAQADRAKAQTFWVGRNNLTAGCSLYDAIRDTDYMVRHLTDPARRFLVLSVTNTLAEYVGGVGASNYATILAVNGILATRYDDRYVDIRRKLIDDALYVTGTPPTTQDLIDVQRDTIPTSLHAAGGTDTIHFNTVACAYIVAVIAQEMRARGFFPGLLPHAVPGAVMAITAGTATTSTQPLTWTAPASAPGTVGYKVEAKRSVDANYVAVGAATTGAYTVAGLQAGTSYDYRITAINEAGPGAPVTKTGVSTASAPPILLVSDGFSGADGTALNGRSTDNAAGGSLGTLTWAADSQLSIQGNRLGASALSAVRFGRVNVGSPDHRAEATFAVLAGSSAADNSGLVVRWTDANNYYRLAINGDGTSGLYRRLSGTTTIIGNPGTFAAGDIVGFSVVGGTMKVYRNGVEVFSGAATSISTGNLAGVHSAFSNTGFRLDDFKVYDG